MNVAPAASRLSINTATLPRRLRLEEIIDLCARHGIGAIAPWRHQLAELGLKPTARRIRDAGMSVSGLCRGGFFTGKGKAGLEAALDDNYRAVDQAAELNARCLVLVAGGLPERSRDLAEARALVAEALGRLLPYARAAGVALAIEPLHPMYAADRACINTLTQANALCERLGAGLGIAVDVYHVWWDPELEAAIAATPAHRLLAFHICDWLVPTTDLLNDRGMMGDGIIDIRRIRVLMEAAGYVGPHEVEIFSNTWWGRDPDAVLSICKQRHSLYC